MADVRILRLLRWLAVLPPLVATSLLPFFHPGRGSQAVVLMLYLGAVWLVFDRAIRRRAAGGALLALTVFNLLLVTPEVCLRLADFRYQAGVQFGHPRLLAFDFLVPDEELFWTFPPDDPEVSSWGFPGPEVEERQPGTKRILVLGDSVAQQGWPRVAETLLTTRPGTPPCEVVSLSIAGYSSHHGRVLARRYGERVAPDLVIVAYGWNDHWLAWQAIDAEKRVTVPRSALRRHARQLYHRSRSTQLLHYLLTPGRARERPLERPRVPPAAYRDNLEAIGEHFARRGAKILLVTAPSAHGRRGVPEYLIERGFAADAESVLALHRQYVEITRQVARARGWPLLDLAAEVEALTRIDDLFIADGIHLTDAGTAFFAARFADVASELLTPPAPAGRMPAGGDPRSDAQPPEPAAAGRTTS